MGISYSDLSPAAQEQVAAKCAADFVRKKRKYKNEKTEYNGIVFDSHREANRYAELLVLQRAGKISCLKIQQKFELVPAQRAKDGSAIRSVSYVADFVYQKDGETVVEDAKGYRTDEYKIKWKLMLERYGIEVKEV